MLQDRELIGNVVERIRRREFNEVGKLAKMFVDSFYLLRDQSEEGDNAINSSESWIEATLNSESKLRKSLSPNVLSTWNAKSIRAAEAGYELYDRPLWADKLIVKTPEDEEDKEWMETDLIESAETS